MFMIIFNSMILLGYNFGHSFLTQAPAAVAVAVGALRSPRDIRMDSSGTEEVLGFKFATVESILLASLHIV